MNQEKFEDLTNRYVKAEKKFVEFLDRFVLVSWEEEKPKRPEDPLTKENLKEFEDLREDVHRLEKEWMDAARELTS